MNTMNQSSPQKPILLGETRYVKLDPLSWVCYTVQIHAKVKGSDIYVVGCPGASKNIVKRWMAVFGLPNRYLELEWGSFSGKDNEFMVKSDQLREVP